MKAIVAHLFLLVFVTNAPGGTTQPINSRPVDTSKIIRFFGSSFIKYDLIQLPSEVRRSVNKESMHLSFYTRSSNGLMWLYIGPDNEKVHISVRDGALLFVMDDGRRLPQQVVVQDPQSRSLMNRWVKVRVEKEGRTLKFYLDDQYVTQVTANENINLLGGGVVYMGGVLQPSVQTGGVISENYNGFLAHVESRKLPAPSREMITNFLQFADTAVRTGDVEFLDRDYWESRKWTWEEVTTPVPERPTPITFKSASSVLVIRDDLDMRRSGSFSFRFRTLEPRGLLAMASGNSQTVQANFIAIEIFDGILYMVYEVGTASSRKHVSNRRVDDGEWHDVVLKVDGNQLIVSLDGQQVPTTLQQADALRMYFFNLYIGGFEDFKRVPWALYSRQGYRGCLESLKVNNIGADLHNFDSKVVGIEVGCRTMTRFCQRQPCVSGFCRDRMDSYACDCANTPFTGQDCDTNAVIASWDGTKSTNFEFLNRDVTHTNDISFRFLTPLRNTLLFKTEVANSNDYIQGELVEGRVKVTMSVGGQTKTFFTGENLNDYFWHTLYIRRRADDIEIQVDNLPKRVGILGGNNFNLKIDRIKFGSLNSTGGTNSFSSNNYIGYMQNFIYGDQELFNQLKKLNSNVKWYLNVSPDNLPLITYKPVTVTTSNTYFQLPPLKMGITMKILFKFKTRESNGLLLYNGGTGKDVIAIELSNGLLRLAYNLGGRNMFSVVQTKTPLNDNEWHTVQVSLDERGQFSLRVDDENLVLSTSDGNQRLELSGALYIAGMPEAMFRKPEVTGLIESRKGFRGCIASMDLNGAVPDLVKFSPEKHLILDRCTDLEMTCKPNACGPGVCVPGVDDYRCDCDMTGYVGRPCNDYPVGYYFGRNGANGMVIYQYPFEKQADSDMDQIAFGFMTEREDGVLYRVQSSLGSDEFIEIRLENGFVIAESNTGGGIIYLAERSKMFNDGKYHVVRYIRTSTNSTLQVDQMPFQSATHTGGASVFNKVYTVMMGGRTDSNGAQIMNFNGIMGGAYYNGHRWFDVLSGGRTIHGKSVERKGDVVLAKPYILVKGGGVKPTIPPPDVYIPPNSEIPGDLGGGGIIIGPEIGGANGGGGPDVIGIGGAGGVTGLFGGAGINVPGEPVPLASAMVGPAPPPLATGARAGAVVGTVLGTLAFMSSLMWALYKLKPGVPTCLSPGAGSAGAGAGGGGMSISQPRATSNLGAVQAASAGGGGAGGGAGAGAGKVTVVNGSAAGGGAGAGGGGGSSTYTSYFQSTSTSVGGAGAGGAGAGGAGAGGAGTDQFDSATLRATGTFSNKGTAIGTPGASRAALGSSSTAYSSNYQSNTMQSYGSGQGSPPVGTLGGVSYERNYMASNDGIPDYDLPVSGTMQSGNSYSSSTLNTHYNYQVSGSNTSSSRYLTSNQVVPNSSHAQSHTSILSVILANNRSAVSTPIRHEVYTASLAPAENQGFVDRAEDMVIQVPAPIVYVKPMVTIEDINSNASTTHSQVTLHVGNTASASYKAGLESGGYTTVEETSNLSSRNERHGFQSDMNLNFDNEAGGDFLSTNRKTSLQVTPNSKPRKDGYERLDSYSSETNISTMSSSNTLPGMKSSKGSHQFDTSRDTLYESTTTITSTVRSDSVENNLFSLEEENADNATDKLDTLMASLGDFNTNIALNVNHGGDQERSAHTRPNDDVVYAKVDKNRQQNTSIEMDNFNVSVKAELTENETTTKIEENHDEPPMSFNDTIRQFQNFSVNVDQTATGHSTPFGGSQIERAENVIEVEKPTFKRQTSGQKTENNSFSLDLGNTNAPIMSTTVEVQSPTVSVNANSEFGFSFTPSLAGSNESETTFSSTKTKSTVTYTQESSAVGPDLEDELTKQMNALLTGINVDTSEWSAVKDITSLEEAGAIGDTVEVQNQRTVAMNRQGQYVLTSSGFSGAVTPGAAADEVRVDCCLMTADGRSVVTGSSIGPPQAWDMQNGELQTIMKGDTVGSTNLHLVCGDRLLVGAVHADMEINEYSGRKGVFNHTLQIWDFQTGKPLSMAEGEYCSAMCPMSDSDKVLFARTDKFGDATSIIAWDLMGNQMIKEMRYDAPVGNNDYVSYLNKSKNDRYVVAGFTNSFDNCAEFMVFDMNLTSYNINEPAMLKLDASPECTAILPKDEAVTGLRNGDLVIWSIRTGQPSRQLLGSGGAHAHSREVKSVTLSEDGKYLVSASADGTLKVWDMNTERPIHTLSGHSDEVCCSAISADNEIVVSGSSDGTIRLWRMKNGTEMCVFNCGIDIFFVTMSHDKGTIVALADKLGARKLIMLQVVRTKIKKIVSS